MIFVIVCGIKALRIVVWLQLYVVFWHFVSELSEFKKALVYKLNS